MVPASSQEIPRLGKHVSLLDDVRLTTGLVVTPQSGGRAHVRCKVRGIVTGHVLLAIALTAAADRVHAETYFVHPDGTGDYPTIQAAIDAAADGDEIVLLDGTFSGRGNFELQVSHRAITIRSSGGNPANCVITGFGEGPSAWAFEFGAGTSGFLLEGVSLTGATSSAVRAFDTAAPEVRTCWISDNTAAAGGGLWCGPGAVPRFVSCLFIRNVAEDGGAVWSSGAPSFDHCFFVENRADGSAPYFSGDGGAIRSTGSITLNGCGIGLNVASGSGGGAVIADGELTACEVSSNEAHGGSQVSSRGYGGGLHIAYGENVAITDCSFTFNVVEGSGGGVYCESTPAVITRTTFSNNRAIDGGGLYIQNGGPDVTECQFTTNVAENEGGGIAFGGTSTVSSLMGQCTIAGNRAYRGGGLRIGSVSPYTTISDCLITGNEGSGVAGGILLEASADARIVRSTIAANRTNGAGGGLHLTQACHPRVQRCVVWGSCANGLGDEIYVTPPGFNPPAELELNCSLTRLEGIGGALNQIDFTNATFFGDPRFCEAASCASAPTTLGDFTVSELSMALGANNPCGEDVGARGQGCLEEVPVEPVSWGQLKSRFR